MDLTTWKVIEENEAGASADEWTALFKEALGLKIGTARCARNLDIGLLCGMLRKGVLREREMILVEPA